MNLGRKEIEKIPVQILTLKTTDSTHNAVVALMRLDSTGKILTRATGVLINSRVILTAGHVNYKPYQDAANSMFIKLWRDVKHSTINRYFAFVVN